jgi:alkylation response protein AidB-like acyl-CoA dehydrogenase
MDVLLDEDEELLRDAIRHFFESECHPVRVRAAEDAGLDCDTPLWQQLADLGWLGLALPALHGGADAPLTQLGLLFEEAGRALAPVPLLPHTVASLTLANHGTEHQTRWLDAAVNGEVRLTWAWSEGRPGIGPSAIQLEAKTDGNGWRLNGIKHFVDGAQGASACLVAVRTSPGEDAAGLSLACVDLNAPGLTTTRYRTLAGDAQCSINFDDVHITGEDILGAPNSGGGAIRDMFELAVILNCAMTVGATRQAVERAVAYAKERQAFGKALGAFQAIQHMCANMITWVDGAELLTREALWMLSQGQDASLEIAGAKAFANERCQAALREANQIHGGLAQVREYDQQLWYRRASAWTMRLGTSLEHRREVAKRLRLVGTGNRVPNLNT